MLDFVRKKQKSILVKVAFAIIILSFVIGYALLTSPGDSGPGGQDPTVAVTINDTKIGYDTYQMAYANLYQLYQSIYRDQFNPALERQLNLRQQALDGIIEQTLLLQEAERLKLQVPKQELVDSIAAFPAFQVNGAFNKERYLQVLNYQRMTPEEFENQQRSQILAEKVRKQLQENITVSDAEVEKEFRDQNEKVNLAFVRLAPEIYETRVKVEEQALKQYFEEHQEEYRIPETLALRYIAFDPASYENEVTIAEEDLEKYYRRHLDQFEIQEQVDASHVLIKVTADTDADGKAKKRELAQKVLDEARAGKDFATLARTYSDDAGSAANGGKLGYFTRGTMVGPFEQAAFALKPGDLSDIVETSFGFHIIKVEGRIDAGVKPLADVLDQVKQGVRTEKGRQLAMEKAMDAFNMNRKDGSLDAAAKANDLGIKETAFFSREEPIEGIGDNAEIRATAFALPDNELARPVALADQVLLFTVKERRESRLPGLEEVRAEVENAFRASRARDLAQQTAEKILAGLKEGKSVEDLAGEYKEKVEETDFFTRSYGAFVPRLGSSQELADAAFGLTKAEPAAPKIYELNGRFVIATLKARQEADLEELTDGKKGELQQSLQARKQAESLEKKVQELREKAKIIIAPNLLASFEGN
ncbi:peptidylprolyl isomerase [Desulfuromonas versatilis]|uniref:Periplasmic chaperone PpiD n=1 Tax=Desulfuromonas versatilis TaxID=2802975 RepID=A0ABN6DWB6_9BACT|nr:SurA N-terminal domain-containing protein [Desulfuromonas versatilis]BCR04365.1 peptidylprolyl isomerase [Desulfuromonas versatilis]